MFRSLRRRLVAIYTVTSGIILTLVFVAVLIYGQQQYINKTYTEFQTRFYSYSAALQRDNKISDAELAEMENNLNMLVFIDNNGSDIFFSGIWDTPTDRAALRKIAAAAAETGGVSLDAPPVSTSVNISKITTVYGENGDSYFCVGASIAKNDGYLSLVSLRLIEENPDELVSQRILLLCLDIGGIAALFFLSLFIVDRTLKPVRDAKNKQNEFIAAASHELRSPLAVIMAANDKNGGGKAVIDRECRRMSSLIGDMLTLASADADGWRVQTMPLETDTLMIETYEGFLGVAEKSGIKLGLTLGGEQLPKIEGDREKLSQVLFILLDNAVSHSGGTKSIELEAVPSASGNYVLLSVIDHGKGIADEEKELVFDRFYRADKSRTDKKHFGLGLSVAKELVRLHGGTISVSDTEGGGCRFTIKLRAIK